MSGVKLIVNADFSKGTLIKYDRRLNQGTILLIEPARDSTSGLPSALRNYAADNFESLSGSDASSLVVSNTLLGTSGCLVERTARGALHGVVRPGAFGTHSTRLAFGASIPDAIRNYLVLNRAHSFYFGMMGRVTRGPAASGQYSAYTLGGVNPNGDVGIDASSNIGFGAIYGRTSGAAAGSPAPSDDNYINRRLTVSQPYFVDVACNGHGITSAEALTGGRGEIFTMGERTTSPTIFGWPSHIVYNVWIEDLTVSSRSYAQASAEGFSLFEELFSAGGHYYDDSWTDPESVSE